MFKKRETPIQNIAYLALMSAINVIFVLMSSLLPPLMFVLVFILPLTNTVVTLFCKKRYYPIFFIVTVGLCLLTTFSISMFDTFLYVIPSMVTGFIFGILIEKNIPSIHSLVLTTAIQYIFVVLTFYIINLIVPQQNFIDAFLSMFGLQNFKFKEVFIHVFCFLLASIQNLISYIVIKYEIPKLGYQFNHTIKFHFIEQIVIFVSLILGVVTYFIYPPLVYIFVFIPLYYFISQIMEICISKNITLIIIEGAIILLSIFSFALLYSFPVKPLSIILLYIPIGLTNLVHISKYYLIKK